MTEPQLDSNGDGIVDDTEYTQYRRKITVEQEKAIAENADQNRDGIIDDAEWATYSRRHEELGHPLEEPHAPDGQLPQPARKIITGLENIVEGVIMPLGSMGKSLLF